MYAWMCGVDHSGMLDFWKVQTINASVDQIILRLRNKSETEWFSHQKAVWNFKYQPEFMESFTKLGISWTFNSLEPEKLFTSE